LTGLTYEDSVYSKVPFFTAVYSVSRLISAVFLKQKAEWLVIADLASSNVPTLFNGIYYVCKKSEWKQVTYSGM
jgi:hypothetical protein